MLDPEITESINAYATVAIAFTSVVIALFAWKSHRLATETRKVSETIAALTGAMETHSSLMMQLEAKKQGVKLTWWDPTQAPFPNINAGHRNPIPLDEIFVGMPFHLRQYQGEEALKRKTQLQASQRNRFVHEQD